MSGLIDSVNSSEDEKLWLLLRTKYPFESLVDDLEILWVGGLLLLVFFFVPLSLSLENSFLEEMFPF